MINRTLRISGLSLNGSTLTWLSAAAVVGASVTEVLICWLNLCGTSPVSLAALAIGFTVGGIVADWIGDQFVLPGDSKNRFSLQAMLATALLVSLCWLMPMLMNATLLAGCETVGLGGSLASMLTMLFPALIVAAVTATAGFFFQAMNPQLETSGIRSLLAGATGVLALLIHSWISFPLALTITLMVVIVIVCRVFASTKPEIMATQSALPIMQVGSNRSANREHSASASITAGVTASAIGRVAIPLHMTAAGILIVSIIEVVSRLMPGGVPVVIVSSFMAAMVLMLLSTQRVVGLLTDSGMSAFALLTIALLPVTFGSLAEWNLSISTQSSSAFSVILLRSLQCALLAIAALFPAVVASASTRPSMRLSKAFLAFTTGYFIGLVLISRGFSLSLVLATGIAVHAAAAFLAVGFIQDRFNQKGGLSSLVEKQTRGAMMKRAAVPLAMMALPVIAFLGTMDTARTSSLLFSPRTVAAIERGVARDLIAQSDANRLVVTSSGLSGEISVWQRAGNVVEFQRNGVSLGRISTDTNLSPQPAEEILPAIMALVSHPHPSRVLLLGDDTGVCLRSCSHFPVQEIVAIRSDERLTELARAFTWARQNTPADKDSRITIQHSPQMVAMRDRRLKAFDVVVATSESATATSAAFQYTNEFYRAARSRMTSNGVFCQRFRQQELGPEPIRQAMSTMMSVFAHVGAIQTVPGEILLFATEGEKGLVDPEILSRLQRDHVRREIASAGWDWSQVAILPLLDANDPIGIFSHNKRPAAISISNGGFAVRMPVETARRANKWAESQAALSPHQLQLLAAVPMGEDHAEVKRRLSALNQQLEILAGMPDQPWTYRKSLRMELQQNPRPPIEKIEKGNVVRAANPLDILRSDYFQTLGDALMSLAKSESLPTQQLAAMDRFTQTMEPLLSHFAHYEIIRLHELSKHPSPIEEFRHRLHVVFFTSPSDASVRPVISAIEQLVNQPDLVPNNAERYDLLNSLIQKLTERWEARTAWEPRSALRVQNDVDQSVRVTNLAMQMMETSAAAVHVDSTEFLRRRRFITAALINPLRDYRDQVLAHRMKTEAPAESGTEDPNDMPLLNSDARLSTN